MIDKDVCISCGIEDELDIDGLCPFCSVEIDEDDEGYSDDDYSESNGYSLSYVNYVNSFLN